MLPSVWRWKRKIWMSIGTKMAPSYERLTRQSSSPLARRTYWSLSTARTRTQGQSRLWQEDPRILHGSKSKVPTTFLFISLDVYFE